MTRLSRYARGLLVATAALALTAGAAFAARDMAPGADHSATTVTAAGTAEPTETPDAIDAPEATETPDPTDAPEATDAAGGQTNTARPQNHGWFVSQAAQATTPTGFANHGAYVKSIAQGSDGKSANTHRGNH